MHGAGQCLGFRSPEWGKVDQCRVCWLKHKPDFSKSIVYSTSLSLPMIRPKCAFFGDLQAPCPCGDKQRAVHHCLNEENEQTRCWRSSQKHDDKDVASCQRCDNYENGLPKLSVEEMGSILGGEVRAYCITLDRRPDRWKWFKDHCLVKGVERVAGVDGKKPGVPQPGWWQAGRGAWGCYLSHVAVLAKALDADLDRKNGVVLIFEDDALFERDFASKARSFLRSLPSDWQQCYLGGQHLGKRQPERMAPGVVKCFNVNRAHAYALRGEFIAEMHNFLIDCNERKRFPHHVDHRMMLLHAKRRVYGPERWLVGQRGGVSDIGQSFGNHRFWR